MGLLEVDRQIQIGGDHPCLRERQVRVVRETRHRPRLMRQDLDARASPWGKGVLGNAQKRAGPALHVGTGGFDLVEGAGVKSSTPATSTQRPRLVVEKTSR